MKTVRICAALAVAMAGLWFAPPAHAGHVTVAWEACPSQTPAPDSSDPIGCVPSDGTVVERDVLIRFRVSAGSLGRIRDVRLYVLSDTDEIPSPGDPEPGDPIMVWTHPDFSSAPGTMTYEHLWKTRELTPFNGTYIVHAEATSHDPNAHTGLSQDRTIHVDNLPVTPSAPQVVTVTDKGVSLRWSPAPEPDVRHYRLYRARTASASAVPKDADFTLLEARFDPAEVCEASCEHVDAVTAAGAHWYKVQVVRTSGDPNDRDRLTPSQLSPRSEKPGVIVAPTPSPAPAVEPKANSGGTTSRNRTSNLRPLAPRPLPRAVNRPPPVDDAPFTAVLPYDLEEGGQAPRFGTREDTSDIGADRGFVPALALGFFLVSAALALGRMPAV